MFAHRNILIVMADGEHARFVQPGENHALHTVASFDAISAHQRTSDMGHDAPGASYHTGSTAHHALNPHHDPHHMAMESFERFVAGQVNERVSDNELLIIALARSSAEIVNHLRPGVRARVIDIIKKDLMKVPDDKLMEHIKHII
ncbi:host attachment protein [Komagataeibacter sp. FNDCR2]|uniref:host attachment protein n=1 Tax=Komagataeibacter sp. FNDCR2 TaxID=2878682 RepID=UPI001E485920|nr:host attachment protein [Komagataeibacter sp. FNDCR2]MCE2575226.1 host attachment protein [Komagataeibacter sp. FNDCR2]